MAYRIGLILIALIVCFTFSACSRQTPADIDSVYEAEAEKALNDGYIGEIVFDGNAYYLQLTESVESTMDSGEKFVTDKIYFESEDTEQLEAMVGQSVCVKGTIFNYRGASPLMFDRFELEKLEADDSN